MKKTIFVLAAAMLLGVTAASAQGVLGKLKDKAGKAIESKVESAVGGLFGDSDSSSDSSSSSNVDPDYAKNLAASNDDWKPTYSISTGEEGYEPAISFKTFSEALAAMPALPKAKDISTKEGLEAYAKKVMDYGLAVQLMQVDYMGAVAESTNAIGNAIGTSAEVMSSDEVNAAMEVAEEYMKLPKEEQEKIEKMSKEDEEKSLAYVKANHPALYKKIMAMPKTNNVEKKAKELEGVIDEEKADRYNAVGEKLQDIQSKKTEEMAEYMKESLKSAAKAALTGKTVVVGTNPVETEIMTARAEIIKEWAKSEEAAQVMKMENELNKKVNKWMKDNKKGWNDPLPEFWDEGRKAQNEVIDKFNARMAEKWVKAISDGIAKQLSEVKEIIALDDELEAIRGGADGDMIYWQNKTYSGFLSGNVCNYLLLHRMALDMPLVNHVVENSKDLAI